MLKVFDNDFHVGNPIDTKYDIHKFVRGSSNDCLYVEFNENPSV